MSGDLAARVLTGDAPPYSALAALSGPERERQFARLLEEPAGRRWLRGWPELDAPLAGRLLSFEDDYRTARRDASLAAALERAADADVLRNAVALASGPAATALWRRLSADGSRLEALAEGLAGGMDRVAAETTLELVVLDPLDPWTLGIAGRAAVAGAGMGSPFPSVRGLAAEFIAEAEPERILAALEALVRDADERLRSVAWRVGFARVRGTARELAFGLLGDEGAELAVRRSALLSAGEYLPTDELVELLTWFVAHPDPDLAGDAANLLHALHRNPLVAEAALHSPHAHVRETAERLLDPMRGSPAAGGNRPGSPVDTGAIFEDLLRRETERRASE